MDPITTTAATQSLGIFAQFVNWEVVIAVVLIVELAKIYIPDNLEPKLLPVISIAVGGLISVIPQLHLSIIVGLVSGFTATAGYNAGFIGIQKIVNIITTAMTTQPEQPKQ